VAVVLVAVAGWFAILPHGGTSTHETAPPPARAQAAAAPPVLDAAESGLLPWHLAAPLSREVVVPGSPGQLTVLGGLTPAGTLGNVERVDVLPFHTLGAAKYAALGLPYPCGEVHPPTARQIDRVRAAFTAAGLGTVC